MKHLLDKPLRAFTIYAIVILVFSIPAYYYAIERTWVRDLDKNNYAVQLGLKRGLKNKVLSDIELDKTLEFWDSMQPRAKLIRVKSAPHKRMRTYEIKRMVKYIKTTKMERFRGLSHYITVNGKIYHLTVETNFSEKNGTFRRIGYITFIFFVLLVSGFILLNRIISQKIWQPFQNTLDKLKSFNLNKNSDLQLEKSNIIEFEEMNKVLNKLIENNISTYNQQKEFAENASHELQTPLALIKSKLDLLLQDKSLTKTQSEMITSLNIPLARVSRINKNLLLLAKIENRQFEDDEKIELNQFLEGIILLLSDHSGNRNIKTEKYFREEIVINVNRSLLEILFTNLLLNAIRHNIENGKIVIEFSKNTLSISNIGFTPLKHETLFRRFISASDQTGSSGLGLAIAKEICSLYQWHISYNFTENMHVFSIRF